MYLSMRKVGRSRSGKDGQGWTKWMWKDGQVRTKSMCKDRQGRMKSFRKDGLVLTVDAQGQTRLHEVDTELFAVKTLNICKKLFVTNAT